MEHAHLVRLKRTNDSVQHATIMEQDEVLFLPVVRVHQLNGTEQRVLVNKETNGGREHAHLERWQDAASCTVDLALP